MCLGSSDRSMTQQVGWPKPPAWDDRPPIKVGDDVTPSMDQGKNVGSTNKKSSLKAKPTAQSSKNTGLY